MNEQDTANFQRLLDRLSQHFGPDQEPVRADRVPRQGQLTETADQAAATAAYSVLPAP
ncbi:hypothetical protein ACIA8O_26295 [Kitasatospora sp. NPDC051853]|uniref:hypothetical protein n=1 Tax=Kitasatospora sp. NPDC051853 TaxID=3364058 RepID=UPI00378CB8FB